MLPFRLRLLQHSSEHLDEHTLLHTSGHGNLERIIIFDNEGGCKSIKGTVRSPGDLK